MNLMSLLPLVGVHFTAGWEFAPATSRLDTTLALGTVTILFVHGVAIKENGLLGYLAHLGNWIPTKSAGGKILQFVLLTPLMFVIHSIGEMVKPITLSFRLFVNMNAKEQIIIGLLKQGLAFFPMYFILLLLALVVSIIQAFLFTTLTGVYISLFMPHEEGHGEEEGRPHDEHPVQEHT
jgi:F-type H+-transporting ATPase subunit a